MAVQAALKEREQLKKEAAEARVRAAEFRAAQQRTAPVPEAKEAPAADIDAERLAAEIASAADAAAERSEEILESNEGETGEATVWAKVLWFEGFVPRVSVPAVCALIFLTPPS